MFSPSYVSIDYSPCVDSPLYGYNSGVNQEVGYKWYQSLPSSDIPNMDMVTGKPWNYTYQVSNPSFYQLVEYTPPPTPPHLLHSAEPPPSPHLYSLPFTLTCHTTLSTGQPYFALESTASVTSANAITDSPKLMDNSSANNTVMVVGATNDKGNQWKDNLNQMIAIIEKMQNDLANWSNVGGKQVPEKSIEVDQGTLPLQSKEIFTKLVSPFPPTESVVIIEPVDLSRVGTKILNSAKQLKLSISISARQEFDKSLKRALKPNFEYELAENVMIVFKLHENEYGKVQGIPNLMSGAESEVFHHRVSTFLSTHTAYKFSPDSTNVIALDADVTSSIANVLIQLLKLENVNYVLASYEADARMTILVVNKLIGAIIVENLNLMPFCCLEIIFKMDKFEQGIELLSSLLEQNRDLNFKGFTIPMFLVWCILNDYNTAVSMALPYGETHLVTIGLTILVMHSSSAETWDEVVKNKSGEGLNGLKLQVETRSDTSHRVYELSGEIFGDKNCITPAGIKNSQKGTTKHDAVISSLDVTQTVIISNELDKMTCNIASEEIMLIFNPGGDARNGLRIYMINLFKEMIKNKEVKHDEVALLRLIPAYGHPGELKVLIKSYPAFIKLMGSRLLVLNYQLKIDYVRLGYYGRIVSIKILSDGIMLVGGFNNAEALDYAKKCSTIILFTRPLLDHYQSFNNGSKGNISGVCIVSQLMGLLRWVPGHQSGGTVMLSSNDENDGCQEFCYCRCYLHDYQMIYMWKFKVPIVKRMASAWCWSVITLVIDPENSFVCEAKLVTMEQGNITFGITSAPCKSQRFVQLDKIVMHHDFKYLNGSLEKNWEDHTPKSWSAIFDNGISESDKYGKILSNLATVKRIALAWYWSVIVLVFDPGDISCHFLEVKLSLRTRIILRGMECNEHMRIDLDWAGPIITTWSINQFRILSPSRAH